MGSKVIAKGTKLVTMSGLPPSHWKTLFHLELVRERNKPREGPKKPPTAPFFLQWRGGGVGAGAGGVGDGAAANGVSDSNIKSKRLDSTGALNDKDEDEEEWDAAWSDDEDNNNNNNNEGETLQETKANPTKDNSNKASKSKSFISIKDNNEISLMKTSNETKSYKKRKVSHLRSHLAGLLEKCNGTSSSSSSSSSLVFEPVTQYMSTMGPSAIDVALSTLCHGMHDLEEGLPLLYLASLWLLEACETRHNFEAVNAYLNRFLSIYASTIAGIENDSYYLSFDKEDEEVKNDLDDNNNNNHKHAMEREKLQLLETIGKLRKAQTEASESLRGKMQHTMCLLKHFSRMI